MLDKAKRIRQSFAGPFAELVLAGTRVRRRCSSAPERRVRAVAVPVRVRQLLRDPREPDPAAPARRVLDPVGLHRGPRPPPSFARVHPARVLEEGLIRWERFSVQEVGLAVYGFVGLGFTVFVFCAGDLLLGADLRGADHFAVARRPVPTPPAGDPLLLLFLGPVIRGAISLDARDHEADPVSVASHPVPVRTLLAHRGGGADRRASGLRRSAGRRPVGPGGARAAAHVPAWPRGVPTGRPARQLLRGAARDRLGRGGGSGDRARCARSEPWVRGRRSARSVCSSRSRGARLVLIALDGRAVRGDEERVRTSPRGFDRGADVRADDAGVRGASRIAPVPDGVDRCDRRAPRPRIVAHVRARETRSIRQGEPGDAFYVVGSGQVRVERDGRPVATLGRGDHFGELALLNDVPRNASVTTIAPTRAFRLDREGFEAVVAESLTRRHRTARRSNDGTLGGPVDCWHCRRNAVGVCRFCGRGICEDHAQTQPFVLELLSGNGPTRALVVEDALFCGACTPRPDLIDLPELDA